jgi:hypothetical protein
VIDHAQQIGDGLAETAQAVKPPPEPGDPDPLRAQLGLTYLRRVQDSGGQVRTDLLAQLGEASPGKSRVPVRSQPEAETELGVVLEQ